MLDFALPPTVVHEYPVTVNPALRTHAHGVSSLVYTPVFILSVGPLGPEKKVVLKAGSFLEFLRASLKWG